MVLRQPQGQPEECISGQLEVLGLAISIGVTLCWPTLEAYSAPYPV